MASCFNRTSRRIQLSAQANLPVSSCTHTKSFSRKIINFIRSQWPYQMKIFLLLLPVFSPFIGYWYHRLQRGSTAKAILLAVLSLALLFWVFYVTDTRIIGEEGDWTPLILAFTFYNVCVFQLLRQKHRKWVRVVIGFAITPSILISIYTCFILCVYFVKHGYQNLWGQGRVIILISKTNLSKQIYYLLD